MIVFSLKKYKHFAEQFSKKYNCEIGHIDEKTFEDGEIYHRIITTFKNNDVYLIGSTENDTDTLNLFDLSCAFVKLGAKSLNLVIPYFAYSTMERAVIPNEVVKAKTRARLLSAIPRAYQGNTIRFFNIHNADMVHYFGDNVVAINYDVNDKLYDLLKEFKSTKTIFVSTDEGAFKRNNNISSRLDLTECFMTKRRKGSETYSTLSYKNKLEFDTAIVCDDMVRSGKTLLNTINILESKGIKKIIVVITHALFTGDSFEKISNKKSVEKIILSDSTSFEYNNEKVERFNILSLMGDL